MMQIYLRMLATFEELLGGFLGLLALGLVAVQIALLVMSAVYAQGSIWLQELRLYLNALIFMGGVGYTLAHDAHVRVDLFYRDADRPARAWVDFIGTLVFLVPFIALLWHSGLPYALSAIAAREGSTETAGIAFIYGMKSMILLFALLLSLEALAMLIRNGLIIFTHRERGA